MLSPKEYVTKLVLNRWHEPTLPIHWEQAKYEVLQRVQSMKPANPTGRYLKTIHELINL